LAQGEDADDKKAGPCLARGHMRTSARAAMLARAKADFQAAWEAFKVANVSS
jgi:hypothetical protein